MPPSSPLTFSYKTFKNTDGSVTDVPLDVYLPSKRGGPMTPLIWIHTGGFLQGTRRFLPPHLLRIVEKHGMALIAPDFRLCPQVTIQQVLEDVADSVRWTLDPKARAASGFDSEQLFSSKYILGGSSAGGWPALLLGLGLHDHSKGLPRKPDAVFAIYAITTVSKDLAPFFHQAFKPLPWAVDGKLIERTPLEEEGHLTRCISDRHEVNSGRKVLIRTEAPPASNPVRAALYNFARQEGRYPDLVLPRSEDAPSFCTPSLVLSKLADAYGALTPVLICYGDKDEKVPCSQSIHVIDALQQVGYSATNLDVVVESGADHLFDMEAEKEVQGLDAWLSPHA